MPETAASFEPQSNSFLIGHEKAADLFLHCWQNNSLHNSWLITGIKGIGKATFAYRLARFVLSADESRRQDCKTLDVSPDSQTFKLVAANVHPDFKVLQRDYTDAERKKILKAIKDGEYMSADELKDLKKSAFIRVDDVRQINDFLSRRSSSDGWRVVLIDSVDDMNSAAANAVLKILEEPPYKTLMLLISHNPGRLLPTIRSRCARLELSPLTEAQVSTLLRRYRPELSETEVKKVAQIASGSIGRALTYADNDAAARYDALCALAAAGSRFQTADLLDFCTGAVADEETYALVQELILKFLSVHVKDGAHVAETADCWSSTLKVFAETDNLNLDKKQALITVIANICKQI